MYGRIIVVTKKTALAELLERHNNLRQAAFYLESRGESLATYDEVDQRYRESLEKVVKSLPKDIPHFEVERDNLVNHHFRTTDLVVAIGPDGLFVNLAKYLDGQHVIAVNPDPETIDGVIMQTSPRAVKKLIERAADDKANAMDVVLAEAKTNDGQILYAVNDFLVGRNDQISARYVIEHEGKSERQSSSGVLVATGMGSTGWFRSVCTMADRLCERESDDEWFDWSWDEKSLVYVVREGFPSRYTGVEITTGTVWDKNPLKITSEMPEGGIVFSDGMPSDGITFNSGTVVEIRPSQKKVTILN